ncbi:MAG TPA: phosphoglycerate dehydrogenase [Gemmatimonadaceae bacterium]|nr:phosphoglycerate dehydrogenase [Gemmatimonadaceae bacterium]
MTAAPNAASRASSRISEERFRVLVADAIAGEGLEPLRADPHFELIVQPGLSGEALATAMESVDAVLVRSATRITRESLARATRLKVIGRAGVGVDTIDVAAATERGIAVLTAPSGNTLSAAELTLALMLAVARRVAAADRSMHAGAWERKAFTGVELYGKTLGLVGAGRIGGEVARRARAFGMRVVAYDPFLTEERAHALHVELAPLDDVLRQSDVVSVHVPLTDGTHGLVGARELGLLRPGAFLVNAARGGVVDEQALVEALRTGRLAGAAVDVYAEEPLPADHPLRTLESVVLTPHLGASTVEAQHHVAIEIAEAVRLALLEGDLSLAVNAPAVGSAAMRALRPMLDLAERLGRLATSLTDGPVTRLEVRYAGGVENALRPLAASAMVGVLSVALGRSAVNFVNAMHLAETRGILVDRVELSTEGDYAESLELRLTGVGAPTCVAGALLEGAHSRVIRVNEHRVDIVPRGTLVVIRNRDVPGVIGHVGTVLGSAGINIAEYHQSRLEAGGEALAAIAVDGKLDATLVTALRRLPEIVDVRQVQLD